MRELAMQGANGSLTNIDRGFLDTEFQALKAEVSRIQGSAKFNGKQLLSQNSSTIIFQVGLDNTIADQLSVTFGGFGLTAILSASNAVSGLTASAALTALSTIDFAMDIISQERAKYGAAMNRLQITTSSIQTMRTNLAAANSRIRDVDVALETSVLAKNQVLAQAGASVLAQANKLPELALNLIR